MADYHPLIARAVAGLDKNTGENRRSLYERARTALVECAWAANSKKDCQLRQRFLKLSVKGRKPALIGVAHALAVIIYRTLSTGVPYQEPNQPAPDERQRQRLIRHYVRRLGKLGVAVHSLRPESPTHHKSPAGTRTQHFHHRNEPENADRKL